MTISILTVGVGGQGVITLGKILAIAGKKAGFGIIGYEQKGSAQRGGSAASLVRFYTGGDACPSTRISKGQLDFLLSLELIETARYGHLYADHTIVLSNRHMITPPLARNRGVRSVDSKAVERTVIRLPGSVRLMDFTNLAVRLFGGMKNTNLVLLAWVIHKHLLPIKKGLLFDSVKQVRGRKGLGLLYETLELLARDNFKA